MVLERRMAIRIGVDLACVFVLQQKAERRFERNAKKVWTLGSLADESKQWHAACKLSLSVRVSFIYVHLAGDCWWAPKEVSWDLWLHTLKMTGHVSMWLAPHRAPRMALIRLIIKSSAHFAFMNMLDDVGCDSSTCFICFVENCSQDAETCLRKAPPGSQQPVTLFSLIATLRVTSPTRSLPAARKCQPLSVQARSFGTFQSLSKARWLKILKAVINSQTIVKPSQTYVNFEVRFDIRFTFKVIARRAWPSFDVKVVRLKIHLVQK